MFFWAAILLIGAIVLTAVFKGWWLEYTLHYWEAVGAAVVAGLLFTRRRRAPETDPDEVRLATEFSVASMFFAISIAAILLGFEYGNWLIAVGCGMLAGSVAGLVREFRVERRVKRGLAEGSKR